MSIKRLLVKYSYHVLSRHLVTIIKRIHFQIFSLVTIFLTKISTGYVIEEIPDGPIVEFEEPDLCQNEIEQLTEALKQCYSNTKPRNYNRNMDPRGKLHLYWVHLKTVCSSAGLLTSRKFLPGQFLAKFFLSRTFHLLALSSHG